MEVSIDMSKDDETAQNRIFAEVVEEQTTADGEVTLLCDFAGANYDFDNSKKVEELQENLEIAIKALEEYANEYNWGKEVTHEGDSVVHNYYCYTKGYSIAQEALTKIKEIKL